MKSEYAEVLAEWRGKLGDRDWRLRNLYWIKDVEGRVVLFRPNEVQERFLGRWGKRNAILKARQLGMSTLMGVLMADFVFFESYKVAAIIDWRLPEGKKKLGFIKFQWDFLDYCPEGADRERRVISRLMREKKLRLGRETRDGEVVPEVCNATRLGFRNGSSVYADNTFRGGTVQFMHVSELAKMASRFPERAREVVNGGFESVQDGVIVVESTHEGGRSGVNYTLMQKAMADERKEVRHEVDWRFFFFPWYEESRYRLGVPEGHRFEADTVDYFEKLRVNYGVEVCDEAKVWWEWKAGQSDFSMNEEYPSVPDEAFDAIGEDAVYGRQFRKLREEGRVGVKFVVHGYAKVYCAWDIGVSDHMACVFVQKVGGECRVLGGLQARKSCVLDMLSRVRDFECEVGFKVGRHILPHDGGHAGFNDRKSARDVLRENGCRDVVVVPRTHSVWMSVGEVRSFLPCTVWHERCGEGIDDGVGDDVLPGLLDCMESYRVDDKGRLVHDESSHMADAFRLFVEAGCRGMVEGYGGSVIGLEQLNRGGVNAVSQALMD